MKHSRLCSSIWDVGYWYQPLDVAEENTPERIHKVPCQSFLQLPGDFPMVLQIRMNHGRGSAAYHLMPDTGGIIYFLQLYIAQSKYFERTGGGPEKQKRISADLLKSFVINGDPTGNRTPISGVRGHDNKLSKCRKTLQIFTITKRYKKFRKTWVYLKVPQNTYLKTLTTSYVLPE